MKALENTSLDMELELRKKKRSNDVGGYGFLTFSKAQQLLSTHHEH